MASRFVIGIDLGTTNSALAYVDTGAGKDAKVTPFPIPQVVSPGAVEDRAAAALVPVPARLWRATGRRAEAAVGRQARLLRRRVRPRLRFAGADAARRQREVVALPLRRGPQGTDPAAPRTGYRPQGLAARRDGALPEAPRRSVEPRDGKGRGRAPARSAGHRADGAGVVRRRRARTDCGGRPRRRVRAPHAARRAAGRVLRLARPLRRGLAEAGRRRRSRARGRRRRRHDRLHAHRGRRGRRQPRSHPAGGRRPPAARRRQHGPDARLPRRSGARQGRHEARRQPDDAAHLRLPHRQGSNCSPNPKLASAPVTVLGKGRSVVGGTIKYDLPRTEVEKVLVDGFFPDCPRDAEPAKTAAAGLQELGLPYVSDPGITRHLAQFLTQAGFGTRDPGCRENREEAIVAEP